MTAGHDAFRLSWGIALLLQFAVAGCGGGGGAGGAPAAPANIAPTAAFTADPIDGVAPLAVTFDASSSNDPDGTIANYTWSFGDGATATGAQVTHTFNAGRSGARYNARLTVTDDRGRASSKTAEIRVGPPQGGAISVSGKVQILPSSAVDGDVNDPDALSTPNNDPPGQQLPNPVTLGGYLTRPGRGPDGPLKAGGDMRDYYRVSLAGTETILLTVGEPQPANALDTPTLSLSLLDAADTSVVDATIVTDSGSLTAPGEGEYTIEVAILEGATTYVLNLGQTVPTTLDTRAPPPRLSEDFVPGEIAVVAPVTLALPADFESLTASGPLRLISVRERVRERRALRRVGGGARLAVRDADKYETLAALAELRRNAAVTAAAPNYVRRAHRVPNDPYYRYQWHYPNINLPLAWDITRGSSQVIVAVVDTGILPNHPDIAGQWVSGYDFIRDPARARDGGGIDPDPTDNGDLAYGTASSFHGTHVAGTIAAQSDDHEGVAGVAWNARVMPLRALGRNGGTSYDVMQAVRYAAGLANDSGTLPPQRADVINLSLGGPGFSAPEQTVFNEVRARGVIVVASAGNDASQVPSYPAAYENVLSVAATTIDKQRAPYSNYGTTIALAAPGGNNATDRNGDGAPDGVLSTLADDSGAVLVYGYAFLNGTSMAAPHVAGVAALMKAVHPLLTPTEFDTALIGGLLTEDLGAPGKDIFFGHGLIDAQRAVVAALDFASAGGAPTTPILVGSPSSLNFGTAETEATVEVRNAGTGTLAIVAATSTENWLTVAADAVDAGGLGTYRLVVDRNLVSEGTHTAQALFTADVGGGSPFVVSVVMQKFTIDPAANAGRHYVVLYHPETNVTVNGTVASLVGGEYLYTIANVGPGDYQIYAGTDSDNDNYLCDGGEACGAFRVLEFPETLAIDASQVGRDFVSGYRVNLLGNGSHAVTGERVAAPPSGVPRTSQGAP
jgi:serine protease